MSLGSTDSKLLDHWLIKYIDAVTHAPGHAPAQPGITEALGTTDSLTFELVREGHKAQGRVGKVGRDYSEQFYMIESEQGYPSHLLHITISLVSGLCISGYVIAI